MPRARQSLLGAGLVVFAVGVVLRVSTGDDFYWLALGLQLAGAALLLANAARSRRAAREDGRDEASRDTRS